MTELKFNLVNDGKGGQIIFPIFISQADMDLIEKEFVVKDGDVFVTTYPRSGTTWTEQMVHLLAHNGEQGEQKITDAVPWLETLPHRPNGMHEFLKTLQGRRLFTSHLPYPLFIPELEWELKGEVNNVCFPTGTALFDDTLYIYYGAADERIACASVSLKELVNELVSNIGKNGK